MALPKLPPSRCNVPRTGPWDLARLAEGPRAAGVEKSFTTTLFGPKPTKADETAAVLAFLDTLVPPPNPRREQKGAIGAAIRRGEMLFRGKAHCSSCHREPYYTTPGTYDVKLEAEGSPFKFWNPPSLLGIHDRGPFLHDGRAKTLDEVLQVHHTPTMVGGQELTDEERSDLKSNFSWATVRELTRGADIPVCRTTRHPDGRQEC